LSLYLKYRPKNLDDLVGQDHIKTTLLNAIEGNSLSHAYLFSGPRGTGKTSTARLVAKALTCSSKEMELLADSGRIVDIIEIDAASNRGIDEIRDLREKIQFAPVQSSKKVYIIDEVHMLTKEAFNALLKTLEEPPDHAFFVLATTEIHKIPETILSRCQHFGFLRILEIDIIKRLEYICKEEGVDYDDESIKLIAHSAEGGLRDAISTLEQMISRGALKNEYVKKHLGTVSIQVVQAFSSELVKGQAQNALELVQKLVYEGYDLSQFNKELLECLREALLENVANKELSKRIILIVEEIQSVSLKMKSSIIPQLPLEVACVRLGLDNVESTAKPKGGFLNAIGLGSDKKEEIPLKEKETAVEVIEKEGENYQEEKVPVSAEVQSDEFSLENLKGRWLSALEEVKTPTVKAALKSSLIKSLESDVLTLSVTTDFYYDLLQSTKGTREISTILEQIYGKKVSIRIIKKEGVNLTPDVQEKIEEKEKAKEKGPSVVDMANEVFGS
jgi:DNA polymerase III subunit gamma/tau